MTDLYEKTENVIFRAGIWEQLAEIGEKEEAIN